MPSKKSKVPDGWDGVSNIGEQVPGTPFICFKTPLKPSFGRWPHCHSNPIIKFLINALSCAVYDKRKIFRNWGIEDLVNACPELAMIIDLTHTDRCLLFLHQNPGRSSLSIAIGVDDSLNICHFYQVLILIFFRYYSSTDVLEQDIRHVKLKVGGGGQVHITYNIHTYK